MILRKILPYLMMIPNAFLPLGINAMNDALNPVVNFSSKEARSEITLTKEKVTENFNEGNIWFKKTCLEQDDLKQYKIIATDAFDDLKYMLTYIDFPEDVVVDLQSNEAIKWINVENIRVNIWNYKLRVRNNLLVAKYRDKHREYNVVLTIANRRKKCNIVIDRDLAYGFTKELKIANNFYDPRLFTYVEFMIIDYKIANVPLRIGKYAFQDCYKFYPVSVIVCSGFSIDEYAFKRSNIRVFKMYAMDYYEKYHKSWDFSIAINKGAFEQSGLMEFYLERNVAKDKNGDYVHIGDDAFNESLLYLFKITDYRNNLHVGKMFGDCKRLRIVNIETQTFQAQELLTQHYDNLDFYLKCREMLIWKDSKGILEGDYNALKLIILCKYGILNSSTNYKLLANINTKFFSLITDMKKQDIESSGLSEEQIKNVAYMDEDAIDYKYKNIKKKWLC